MQPGKSLRVEHHFAADEGVAQVPAHVDRLGVDGEVDALDLLLRVHMIVPDVRPNRPCARAIPR